MLKLSACDVITKSRGLCGEALTLWCRRWHQEECQSWTWLLLHLCLFVSRQKHPCKYFSVLQKKEALYSFTWRASFVTFFKKKSEQCPETWNVFFVVVRRSKCMIVCYLLKISPIFWKKHNTQYSVWVVFDGTCIGFHGSDRYLHARSLHLKLLGNSKSLCLSCSGTLTYCVKSLRWRKSL